MSTYMENIEKKLEILGITGKERDVYISLLKLKKATVIELFRESGIKRTTVYHCLDDIIEKGLAIKVIKDNKKLYIAEDPKESLKDFIENKKSVINSLIPDLHGIFGKEAYHPEIRIYRNIEGIKKVFEDILTSAEKISRYYISDFNLEELVGNEYVDDFVRRRINAGIKSKSLRSFTYKPEREKGETHAKQLREVKFLPENISIKPYICIYDNKVVVISTKEEKLGFIIESKEFANAQKAIFDIIWNTVAM